MSHMIEPVKRKNSKVIFRYRGNFQGQQNNRDRKFIFRKETEHCVKNCSYGLL